MKKRIMIFTWIFLFSIFLLLAYGISQKEMLEIDSFFINNVVLQGRSDWLTTLFTAITFFASVVGLLLFSIWFILKLKGNREKLYFIFHLGGVVCISQCLKFIFQRERPLLLYRLVEENGYSFPSGHSMVGASFYGYIMYLLWKSKLSKNKKYFCSIIITLLVLGIGFSRIYLGVHYASDVLAGFCLGICYTSAFVILRKL